MDGWMRGWMWEPMEGVIDEDVINKEEMRKVLGFIQVYRTMLFEEEG
jgi:hypothetical protein